MTGSQCSSRIPRLDGIIIKVARINNNSISDNVTDATVMLCIHFGVHSAHANRQLGLQGGSRLEELLGPNSKTHASLGGL